jgi:urea transporter
MIFIPEKEAPAATSFGVALLRGVPRAYALLFFSGDARLGWWVLALTFFSPGIGLCGLGAAVAAVALGWILGYDRSHLRNGFMVFNPLLVGLSVGWLDYCHAFPAAVLALLWGAAVLGGFFV